MEGKTNSEKKERGEVPDLLELKGKGGKEPNSKTRGKLSYPARTGG